MGSSVIEMEDGRLWVRRGLTGLSVQKGDVEVELDEKLMMDLMADEMRNRLISKLEQMDTKEVFEYFKIDTE